MFRIGQKVVCIIDDWGPLVAGDRPVLRAIYTIIGMNHYPTCCALFFSEIASPGNRYYGAGYNSTCFRPLVSSSTKQSRQAIIDNLIKQPVMA